MAAREQIVRRQTATLIRLPRKASAPRIRSKQQRPRTQKSEQRVASLEQRHQRELAWLLYITEGYIANVEHALTVNAYTLKRDALRLMKDAQDQMQTVSRMIRDYMIGG